MRALIAVLAVLVGLVAAPAPAEAKQGSRAGTHGQWIVDGRGRVLVLHGLNMVYKRPPYAPDTIGFGKDDARFLARNGFTTVRLGLIWKGVEPQPGGYDDGYLARIKRTAKVLARQGIWVLLDFHQDMYHERFQGEGAPDWAVQDDGLPSQPQAGFPGNYFANLGLNRAFDHFWANDPGPGGVGLQDWYAAAWAHVASYFRSSKRILGIDILNEPWPGTGWQACANPAGCPGFDAKLQGFSQKVIDAVRAADPRTAVFYEPNVLFNNGARTSVRPTGARLGFSFHDYCLTAEAGSEGAAGEACAGFDDLVWGNTRTHVQETGHPPLLTEFGATTDVSTITGMVDRAEQAMTGWQFWAYCGCDDPTTTGPGDEQALVLDPARKPTKGNIDKAKLRALVVPHPLTVAGTPTGYHYDRYARTFRATWSTAKAAGHGRFKRGSRTTLAMPRLVFPHGYVVTVTGGTVASRPGARALVIRQAKGAKAVEVVVRAR